LNSADLPTLGRPTMAIKSGTLSAWGSLRRSGRGKLCNHRRETIPANL
jgi:hypothetical protein